MTAHDGFTLKDLYSCNSKNNSQAWPYGPSDGGEDNNNSWDQGGIAADQRKAARNGLALMMLSAGVPMIVGGDEALRSLNCNNNPYNLDSSANWLSWTRTTDQSNFQTFAKAMIAFRKAHPALRPANFYSSARHQRQRDGAAALVQAGRRRGRRDLLQRRGQPCDRLAHRRQRVRRYGIRHLCRAQRLERAGELHAAVARAFGQELVPRADRYLQLGRRRGALLFRQCRRRATEATSPAPGRRRRITTILRRVRHAAPCQCRLIAG
jgi:hypothetical protein